MEAYREDRSDACGDGGSRPQRSFRPERFARSDVLRGDNRNRGQHGRGDEEEETDDFFDDADSRRDFETATVCDDGNEEKGNLDESVLCGDGGSDSENPAENEFVRFQVPKGNSNAEMRTLRGEQGNNHACGLRNDRGEGRALCAQVEVSDENVIQRDVQNAGNRDKVHGTPRIPHAAENRRDDVVCDDERDSGEAYPQVEHRPGESLFGRFQNARDVLAKKQENSGQEKGNDSEQGDRVSGDARNGPEIFRPGRPPDENRRAHGESDDDDRQKMHRLASDGDRRNRFGPLELSDDKEVRKPVKRLQKIGDEKGGGKDGDVF